MSEPSPRIPPRAAIPVGILAVSTAAILIRYAQVYASSLTVAACRLVLAVIFLSPLVGWKYRADLKNLTWREIRPALFSGGLLGIHFASWITSLEYTTVASSVVLVSTTPLWVALLSPLFLGEKITRPVLWGLGLALLGGAVVGISDSCTLLAGGLVCPPWSTFGGEDAFLGDLLALLGALTGAGYLMVGRRLRGQLRLVPYIFLVYGMAALELLIAMLIVDGLPLGYPLRVYGWFALLALVPQLLGHSTFNWALRYLSAAYVSITLLGEPVGSTILAYFFLDERPGLLKIFGAILILLGIVFASTRKHKPLVTLEE